MKLEKHSLPEWALSERRRDLEWIKENLHIFWPAATATFEEHGPGALVVDTTSRPTGEGNPFGYFSQEMIEQYEDEDINRLVKEYNPSEEFVVVLIKSEERMSSYRVKPLQRGRRSL
jgi:hypothetical protein